MSIIYKIQELLTKQSKNQKDLTDYLGLEKSVFSAWKSGKSKSYMGYIPKIAEFFGTTPNEFYEDEIDYENSPVVQNAPLEVIEHFNGNAKAIYYAQLAVQADAEADDESWEPDISHVKSLIGRSANTHGVAALGNTSDRLYCKGGLSCELIQSGNKNSEDNIGDFKLDKTEYSISADSMDDEALKEELHRLLGLDPIDDIMELEDELLNYFRQLNDKGQNEAVKRVKELAQLSEYRNEE